MFDIIYDRSPLLYAFTDFRDVPEFVLVIAEP